MQPLPVRWESRRRSAARRLEAGRLWVACSASVDREVELLSFLPLLLYHRIHMCWERNPAQFVGELAHMGLAEQSVVVARQRVHVDVAAGELTPTRARIRRGMRAEERDASIVGGWAVALHRANIGFENVESAP